MPGLSRRASTGRGVARPVAAAMPRSARSAGGGQQPTTGQQPKPAARTARRAGTRGAEAAVDAYAFKEPSPQPVVAARRSARGAKPSGRAAPTNASGGQAEASRAGKQSGAAAKATNAAAATASKVAAAEQSSKRKSRRLSGAGSGERTESSGAKRPAPHHDSEYGVADDDVDAAEEEERRHGSDSDSDSDVDLSTARPKPGAVVTVKVRAHDVSHHSLITRKLSAIACARAAPRREASWRETAQESGVDPREGPDDRRAHEADGRGAGAPFLFFAGASFASLLLCQRVFASSFFSTTIVVHRVLVSSRPAYRGVAQEGGAEVKLKWDSKDVKYDNEEQDVQVRPASTSQSAFSEVFYERFI